MPDTPIRGSGPPTLEADFRDLRDERGLSLDDLHQETRVPVDVIRRFESGSLLADNSFSDVYLKAFVKGYAKALGIPQARAVAAFDAQRAGRYDGQLREDYTPPEPPVLSAPLPADEPASAPKTAAPAVEALRTGGTAVPSVQTTPKVEATRVERPIVPTAKRSFDRNWGTIGGLAFVLIALVAAALWFLLFRDDTPEVDRVATEQTDDTEEDAADPVSQEPVGPRLQTPLTVVVTAEGDGLQWFRYSLDGEETFTWVEAGNTETYSADSSIVILGEGNSSGPAYDFGETTLEIQGLRWRPQNGTAVRLTVQNGQALLDSLTQAGVSSSPVPASTQPE
ncbi:MAG: helix-turn-helix transcriptional regulator [Bacteroidota bacterium]